MIITLLLIYLIDNGNLSIFSFISSKRFFLSLINLLKIRDIPEVQKKLLNLLKKWGIKFENQKNILPNFSDIYIRLKENGIEFPEYNGTDYKKYFNSDNIIINNDPFYYFDNLKNILKVENFQHKYRRLVDYLLNMNENIKLANELIDIKDNDKLQEIIEILENGKDMLKETIIGGRLKDEKLMTYTLGTADDINNTILRKEQLDKGLNKIQKFKSYFEIKNIFPWNNII